MGANAAAASSAASGRLRDEAPPHPADKPPGTSPSNSNLMAKRILRAAAIMVPTTAVLGALVAGACDNPRILAPTGPAAESGAPRSREIVVMHPVMIKDEKGETQKEYQSKVVELRPVMIGEPIEPPEN